MTPAPLPVARWLPSPRRAQVWSLTQPSTARADLESCEPSRMGSEAGRTYHSNCRFHLWCRHSTLFRLAGLFTAKAWDGIAGDPILPTPAILGTERPTAGLIR